MSTYDPDYAPELDEAERARRELLRKRIVDYFHRRIQADPHVTNSGNISSFWGQILDGERAKALCKEIMKPNIRFLYEATPVPLTGSLYVAGHYFPGGAHDGVFAHYEDSLLWLDDHVSNHDFEQFLQRENIVLDNAYRIATFIADTKFHYLATPGHLVILTSVADIPQDVHRQRLIKYNALEKLNEFEQRLINITPHIYPPFLTIDSEIIVLRFVVWISIAGRVWDITCQLESNHIFSYKAEKVGEWIGDAILPR
jgi:hypothetical protein